MNACACTALAQKWMVKNLRKLLPPFWYELKSTFCVVFVRLIPHETASAFNALPRTLVLANTGIKCMRQVANQ